MRKRVILVSNGEAGHGTSASQDRVAGVASVLHQSNIKLVCLKGALLFGTCPNVPVLLTSLYVGMWGAGLLYRSP